MNGVTARSGCATEKVQNVESLARREGEAVESESLARLDHQLAGGVIVVAAAAVCAGDACDVVATAGDHHDHAVGGDAKPDWGSAKPPARIDAGTAFHADLGLDIAAGLGTKEVLGLGRQGCHISDSSALL